MCFICRCTMDKYHKVELSDNEMSKFDEDEDTHVQLYSFLETLGILESSINEMKSENITCHVLRIIEDVKLAHYIPKLGDRIAVVDFAKRKSTETRKRGVVSRLLEKFARNDKSTKTDSISQRSKPAFKKSTRKVDMGWMNRDMVMGNYVQVRQDQGGGIRRINVLKTITKTGLIKKGKDLFFPGGISKKGNVDQFNFDLYDFQKCSFSDKDTVAEIYDKTGVQRLKFYLATAKIKKSPATSTETSGAYEALVSISLEEQDSQTVQSNQAMYSVIDNSSVYGTENLYFFDNNANGTEIHYALEQEETSFTSRLTETGDPEINVNTSTTGTVTSETKLTLHRGMVMDELITSFINMDKQCGPLNIEMILPNGDTEKALDMGGVYRDALSEFWGSFYERCTVGARLKVPCLRHDFGESQWRSIARVFYRSWIDQRYIPISLAPPFLEYCISGSFLSTDLSAHFLKLVDAADEEVLIAALQDFNSVTAADIMEVLEPYDCKKLPTSLNIASIIEEIAHKELLQKPKYIIDICYEELNGLVTVYHLSELLLNMKPSPKNILHMLETHDILNADMSRVLGFLKKFIREVDEKTRTALLRFSTGADIVADKQIQITFNKTEGFTRSPTAHTCGCILELPSTYDNYQDFKSEFNSVLASNVWIMDLV